MRAAVFHTTGPAEVLAIEDVPIPSIGPDDILVRVKAHTVQPFDTAVRRGWVPATAEVKLPLITGNEFAGTVAAIGSDVRSFAIGDRVAGRRTFGCAAEYLAVPAADVAQLPESLGFAQGAYLGGTGQTAHMAIEFLGVNQRDVLLVHGGPAGSVRSPYSWACTPAPACWRPEVNETRNTWPVSGPIRWSTATV